MREERKSMLIVISGPSGVGKGTIYKRLLENDQSLTFSVSVTTREPREGERDGVDYYFIDAARFRELIAQDAFVEHEEVYQDRFYGTLKSEVERIWAKGHVILFDVDVKGGANLKKYFGPAALSILILPPSLEVLEQRLRGRQTDSEDAIRERLAKAQSEIDFARGKFDVELVNDVLENTFKNAEDMVNAFLCA